MGQFEVLNGTFDITNIFNFIKTIWDWIYLSISAIHIKVGDFNFTLMQFIIALIVGSLVISLGFLTIKVRIKDNMQTEKNIINKYERNKK